MSNETSKFTRIQHRQLNGTVETLLSNEYLNSQYKNSEIHVSKNNNFYIIRIDPVRAHSAGVYSCEDNVSLQNMKNHMANITLHVIGKLIFFFKFIKKKIETLKNFIRFFVFNNFLLNNK